MICRICTVLQRLSLAVIFGMLAIAAYDFVTLTLRRWGVW